MSDPYFHPDEASAAEAIAAIRDELDVFDDWMERYQFIIELGRTLPAFPAAWQNDSHRVPGCQSQVWMEASMQDGRMMLAGASDAAIVSGLVALLLRVYSGRTPAEVLATDPVFLKELGLLEALSTNRGNGDRGDGAADPGRGAGLQRSGVTAALFGGLWRWGMGRGWGWCLRRSLPRVRSIRPICHCGSRIGG